MSNCLVLQGKNFIAIGADTASSILIDGKYRRIGTNAKKLYQFGNEIMFCSGRMELVELVTSNVVVNDNRIAVNDLVTFVKSLDIQKSDTFDLEILICGVENSKSYMHQISQYNDFEVKTTTNETNGCAVYSTGFNAKIMLDVTKKNYPSCQNVSNLFIESFTDISSEEVGGYINMYLIQENMITKCIDNHKVDDIEPISSNKSDVHYVIADCLIGDMIIGETLLISNSTGTFIVDKDGIIVKNMKLDMSNADGSRRIVIDPELDSILSVYTNSKQVFYVDTNGNMCMLGNLYVNNNNMYLKVDMTADNIIEVGYGEITGTGNEGEAGSGEGGGVNTGDNVEQVWEQVDYGQDIYNGATPIIASGIDSNVDTFNDATLFTQYHFLNYGGEIYHLAYGGYLVKYNEKQQTWNLVTQLSTSYDGNVYYSSFVKTNKEDGNIYIFFTGHDRDWAVLYKYNLDNSLLSQVWSNGEMSSYIDGYFDYGRHYIKDDSFYISAECSNSNTGLLKVSLNSDRTLKSGEYSQWCNGNNCIHEIIPYNNEEYGVISIGQSKVILVKFKNIDSFTYNTLYTFDYTMSSNLRTGGIIADVFNDKIYIVFKNMSIHYEYDIKSGKMNELKTFKLSLYGTAENPRSAYGVGVTGFSMIASSDKLHMFALGANQCYGSDIYTGTYSSGYTIKDLVHIPQYYIRHYEYLDDGKIEINKKFQKLTSGYNFYMSRQCSFTKIGDIIYNIPTFWGMLTGDTYTNSKTANYSTWNMPIYALDTTSTDNDFQIICNSIGVPIISVINSNSTSKIYFFAGTDTTYLQYYDLETKTVGSVFTDESGNKVACGLGWHEFSYIDETEQILYEMGTYFIRLDLSTNTELDCTSLGLSVHSNVEVINDIFYFVSLTSDRSKTKLYKITKSGALSTVATMQEADDIGSNMGYSIAYYNNKIHMYYAVNGVLKRKRYEYSFDTGEVTSYTDMFQDNGMYVYDNGLGSNSTCHLPAIATSTGIHYFTGTTYDFNNKFTNPFNHYLYTESGSTPIEPDDPDNSSTGDVDNPSDKIFYITNEGDGYFYGTVYAKDGKFSGDIYARNLTLGENAVVSGKITSQTGEIGKWIIAENGLISPDFGEYTTGTSGLALYSDGNILNRGLWSGQDNAWYAYLYKGKWVFGLGNYFGATTDTPYSDISVNGIYMCSKDTILNKSSQYLFAVDTTRDVVSITSSSSNPALTITNNSEGTCLEIKNNSCTYDNKALSLGVTVVNTDDEGNTSSGMGYITVFGEGESNASRIIMRPDQNIKSTDTTNPANYTNSACGTYYYPWGTMSCVQLYADKTSTTSDAKLKTPINLIDSDTALEFINGLTPREYYFNDSKNKRHHMGFYAQEVSQLAKELNLGDMAIYEAITSKDNDETEYYYDENVDDEHLHWSLNYNEFIAPLVSAVQGLTKKIENLEAENEKLRTRIEKLEDVGK